MTREQKLALIVGFALVLIVGVLVSDHLSLAQSQVAGEDAGLAEALEPEDASPGFGRSMSGLGIAETRGGRRETPARPIDQNYFTHEASTPVASSEEPTLENRAKRALDHLARGAGQIGEILQDSQNHNLPAAQTDTLVTPSLRDVRREEPASRPERTRPEPRRAEAGRYPVHVVKKGESLWTIAERYYGNGRLYVELAEFNEGRTGPEGTVYVGATVLVPPREVLTGSEAPAARPSSSARTSEPERRSGSRTYTVKSGDTLSEISQELLGTSRRWREILELNKGTLEDAESLRVGMTLKIPAR